MNLEALLGLLQGQDIGNLASQVGGNEGEAKKEYGCIAGNAGGTG